MKKIRESNFELLKIISMLMIISFHYVYKSGYEFEVMNFNSFIVKVFWMFGELGVNLFILITGYFMVEKNISAKKLIKIILEVYFYNSLSVICSYYLIQTPITLKNVLFPVIYSNYWFITAYIIVYTLSPYINKCISNCSKNEHQKLLTIMIIIWSVIPTFFGLRDNSTETLLYYTRLIWLFIMYILGAYIKLYDFKFLNTKKRSTIVAIIVFGTIIGSILIIYKYRDFFDKIGTTEYAYLWTPNNIFMLLLSISIFQFFAKLKIRSIRIINTLASTTLGVYMLHDGFLSTFLWQHLFDTKEKLESTYSLLYIIGTALIIFIIGAIIDLIRNKIEKYSLDKILDNVKEDGEK